MGIGTDALINLEEVVAFIRPELSGVTCYVEQTGGGCATIYLGDSYDVGEDAANADTGVVQVRIDPEDRPVALFDPDHPYGALRVVMGGPGHFASPGWVDGRAYPGEFSIGYDVNDPEVGDNDPGLDLRWDVDTVYGAEHGYSGERVIARRMIQLYKDHPRVKRGEVK